MDRVLLRLFGDFELRIGSFPPRIVPTRKAQALLAYLALTPGVHPRDKLAALLWPDTTPGAARKQLRQTLFVLHKVLAITERPVLALTGDAITLSPGALDIDVTAFEAAVANGTVAALEEAAELYRGDLLAVVRTVAPTFDDWLASERQRLRELALQALDRLLAHHRAAGASGPALTTARRLLALNPVQERTHRALMRIHLDLGHRDAALRQYADCVETLSRVLGVPPEPETRRLYEEMLRQPTAIGPVAGVAVDSPDLPLVGRHGEVGRLHQALTEAWAGRGGPVVAVIGEAGVGKTRVLKALAAEAARRGGTVLLGRSYESEQVLPLGPWVSAVREAGVLGRREPLAGVDLATRGQLARVFPELLPASAGTGVADARNSSRLLAAFAEALRALALARPLAIVLEDVHWADDMTLRLLALLARRGDGAPILIAVSARDDEVLQPSALRSTLDGLEDEQRLVRVNLAPLGRDETVTLVHWLGHADSRLSAATPRAQAIWENSGGNPFIVLETLRAIADGVGVDVGTLRWPARVRETIGRRLGRLGEAARQLVRVAAVIGREFDFELLQRAAGLDDRAAAEALEELIRRRVVHAVGRRFDFLHDQIREVALAELLAPRRQLLHAAVAAAMEGRPGDDVLRHRATLAMHFRDAAMWDNAVVCFRDAGREAIERCAYREAIALFEQARAALARLPESRATLEQAFEIRLDLRNALLPLGDLHAIVTHLGEAETLARRLADPSRQVRVASLLLSRFWASGDHAAAVDEGEGALAMAEALSDPAPVVLIRTRLGEARYLCGEYHEAARLLRRNIAALTGEHAVARFGLLQPPAVHSRVWLVSCLSELGQFEEARAAAAEAMALAQQLGEPVALNFAWAGTGVLALQLGQLAEAVQALERAVDVWRADTPPWLPRYTAALGLASALSGDSTRGLELVERALDQTAAFGVLGGRSAVLGWLAETRLLDGRGTEACEAAEEAVTLAARHGELGHLAWALRARAMVRARADDPEGAAVAYSEACSLADRLAMRPLVAHCRYGLGMVFAAAGRPERASIELGAAGELFAALAMEPWRGRAARARHEVRLMRGAAARSSG